MQHLHGILKIQFSTVQGPQLSSAGYCRGGHSPEAPMIDNPSIPSLHVQMT